MKFVEGNVFEEQARHPTLFVVNGHITITTDGALVMHSGGLQEARYTFGGGTAELAGDILTRNNRNGVYGFKIITKPRRHKYGLGLLQTRYGWWDAPNEELFRGALTELSAYMNTHPSVSVRMAEPDVKIVDAESTLRDCFTPHALRRLTVVRRTRPPLSRGFALVEGLIP